MIFYVIRHKKTGQIMPQGKRDRGYSHWNPSNPEHVFKQGLNDVPRLLKSESMAKRVITCWAAFPNSREVSYQSSYTGEYDNFVDIKPDGRTKEDLEYLPVELVGI